MKDIELIEAYLFNKLSGSELKLVQERISNDPPFESLVNEYRHTFAILEKKWLRNNVAKAIGHLFWIKMLKITIFVVAISMVIFIAGRNYFKQKNNSENSFKTEQPAPLQTKNDSGIIETVNIPLDLFVKQRSQKEINNSNVYLLTIPTEQQIVKDSFSSFDHQSLFKNEDQKFTINPSIDNELKCKGGTIVNLLANSMCYINGREPKKEVIITIQEYTDYFAMWKHNVSTTSDNRLLQSGGSCFISAECNGEKVDMKTGRSFTISFPSKEDERMGTFIGERDSAGELNWGKENVEEKVVEDNGRNAVQTDNNFMERTLPDTSYCLKPMISDEGFFDGRSDKYTFNELSRIQDLYKVFDTFSTIKSDQLKKLYYGKVKMRMRFGVDSFGKLKAFDYNFKINKKLERQLKAIAEYIVNVKKIKVPGNGGSNMIINVDLVPAIAKINDLTVQEVDTNASKVEQNKTKERNMNVLVARSGFGYINCDFFYKSKNLTNVKIDIPSSMTQVKIFFVNFNAAANCKTNGRTAQFLNLPESEPILLLGTVVKNEELMMCLKEATVGEKIEMEDFIPFDIEKIKAFLVLKKLQF